MSHSTTYQPTVTELFQSPQLVYGTVYHNMSSLHRLFISSALVWRHPFSLCYSKHLCRASEVTVVTANTLMVFTYLLIALKSIKHLRVRIVHCAIKHVRNMAVWAWEKCCAVPSLSSQLTRMKSCGRLILTLVTVPRCHSGFDATGWVTQRHLVFVPVIHIREVLGTRLNLH